MAGFFGLFNYEKEGPGIDKNAPKKKAFIVFFETFFRNFWKFITINLVYSLISLPVLSSGLAAVGITNVTRNIARDKHSFGLSDFFETVKKNWKQALPAGIINALIYVIMLFDIHFFWTSGGVMGTVGLGISLSILFIFTVMNFYIWTLMITFKFTLKQIYLNSFRFTFINLFKNLGCFFSLVLVYAVYIGILVLAFSMSIRAFMLIISIEFMLYICTFPAFRFLLIQFFTFPAIRKYIIDPYYLEHPDEDIQRRRDLGIEIPGEDDENEDGEDEEDAENAGENEDGDDDDGDLVFED